MQIVQFLVVGHCPMGPIGNGQLEIASAGSTECCSLGQTKGTVFDLIVAIILVVVHLYIGEYCLLLTVIIIITNLKRDPNKPREVIRWREQM